MRKLFENDSHIHVYSPGAGADNPLRSNDFVTVFPIQTHRQPNLNLSENRSRSTQGHHLHNFVQLDSPMLHTKFQDHLPFGSGEDVLRFIPYMGVATILVM